MILIAFVSFALGGCAGYRKPTSSYGTPKFVRFSKEGVLGGVAVGVAYFFGLNVTLVRILWVISTLCFGFGLLPYVILWILMPVADSVPENFRERVGL